MLSSVRTFTRSARLLTKINSNPARYAQNPEIDPSQHLKIKPIKREGETIDVKRARLVYQLRKRGILETDLLLSRFAKTHLNNMDHAQLDEFDQLLDENDWDIYYWATKNDISPIPEKWQLLKVLARLQKESLENNGEILRMPDLQQN